VLSIFFLIDFREEKVYNRTAKIGVFCERNKKFSKKFKKLLKKA